MRLFVVTVELDILKLSTMKRLSALFPPILIFCSTLSSQEFLSIHITDVALNDTEIHTQIDLGHQHIDTIHSELKIASILINADVDYFVILDKSTSYSFTNNLNTKSFNASTNEAFVVISNTGVIDGKYLLDQNVGELNLVSQSNWGNISITGTINVPFEGVDHRLQVVSMNLVTDSNIFNTPLDSIDFSRFIKSAGYNISSITTESGVANVNRPYNGISYFQIESYPSAQTAINSYNIDSDLLDSDGDGYAVWRDDDDTNPSINQANGIYTLSSVTC